MSDTIADDADSIERAFTVPEAAERLGASRSRLYTLIQSGQIVAHKLGRRTVIRQSEIVRFLDTLPEYGADDAATA